ncbi:cysteine--tRNA ligase [candidate division KSB1 bacterium]|nr:cysteine--tRNA ligase [candidate division KSB1 bacterium]
MQIYNTYTGRKEEFKPIQPGKVGIYLCGPTVYDYFHIGNARPLLMFDIFRRYLSYRHYDVKYVVNVTDIDDKLIKKAQEEHVTVGEVARKFTDAYFEDIKKLRIEQPDVSPRATDHIPEMIDLIKRLIANGHAYELDGDVYFRVRSYPPYGRLSGKNIDDLQSGARVEVDERKEAPLDFALWKSAKPGEPHWDSPWGQGRPGWHIECSVMSMKYLGENFDIHAGGVDLIFPHHENEIAQSEGATHVKFVNYWLHNGFLNVEGEKMSKSLGNFFTAREIVAKYRPEVIRMFFLLKHYRSPINFSEERICEARQALERIVSTLDSINTLIGVGADIDRSESEFVRGLKQEFIEAMDDDFNTALAIAKLFELVKEANLIIAKETITENDKSILMEIRETFYEYNTFLSILPGEQKSDSMVNEGAYIDLLLEIRRELRIKQEWKLADQIRDRLNELNIEIKDSKDGTIWRRK